MFAQFHAAERRADCPHAGHQPGGAGRSRTPGTPCAPLASRAPEKGRVANHNPPLGGERNEILKANLVSSKESRATVVDMIFCFQSKFVLLSALTGKADEYKTLTEHTDRADRGKVRLLTPLEPEENSARQTANSTGHPRNRQDQATRRRKV